jgi:hypothetical protein
VTLVCMKMNITELLVLMMIYLAALICTQKIKRNKDRSDRLHFGILLLFKSDDDCDRADYEIQIGGHQTEHLPCCR